MQRNLPCSYEEMRSLVIRSISQGSQLTDLFRAVGALAQKEYPPPAEPSGSYGVRTVYFSGDDSGLSPRDKGWVNSIFWDLFIEGIVRPGLGDGLNNALPFYNITERGKQILADGQQSPYDPDGYLKRLKNDVPTLDDVVMTYLVEALSTFRIGCLLSSTVAVGCASEKVLLLLIEAYAARLPEPRQGKFRKDVEGRMIKRQFEEFQKHLDSAIKPKLPGDLKDDLDVHVLGVFSLFRSVRNDAGHPTGKQISRDAVNVNIQMFAVYVRHVYRLIAWLETQAF